MTEHILFLTGRLAERRLARVIAAMEPLEFTFEIRGMGVSVAALMTAQMLRRRLERLQGVDRIIVPGLCRGDLDGLGQELGVPVTRGPVDVKDLPAFFDRETRPLSLDRYAALIFAEIVDAPLVNIDAILARAAAYARDGADVIDLGCLPDTPFPHLEDAVGVLREAGYRVSVDSLEDEDLLRGGRAGADYLLSLKESNAWIAQESAAVPVLIPEQPGDLPSLYRLVEKMRAQGKPCIADSILDPIHFGFTDSLVRYRQLRERFPDADIMMGVGNLSELTEADTCGVNALLCGVISELDITHILATEVSPHACSAVRELDRARRIMYAAKQEEGLPKGIDGGLLTTHARRPFACDLDEVRELAAQIKDPSYRVQVTPEGIHVFNRDGLVSGRHPDDLFPRLPLLAEDASHAFYMGAELAKARIALELGKRYVQDNDLDWGVAVPPKETARRERNGRDVQAPAGAARPAKKRGAK